MPTEPTPPFSTPDPPPPTPLHPPQPAPDEDEGAANRFFRWAFGRSWRTALAGYAAAGLAAAPPVQAVIEGRMTWAQAAPQIAFAFAVAVLARQAKDDKATGLPR